MPDNADTARPSSDVMRERLVAPCPHPKCQGNIKLAPDLPAGVYQCICHSCDVRWDGTTLTLERAGQSRYLPPPAATNPIPNDA